MAINIGFLQVRIPLLVFLVSAVFVHTATAQTGIPVDSIALTMNEAVERAKEHNFSNLIAEQEIEISRNRFQKTNSLFLPNIYLEESAITTNNPLNVFGSLLRQETVSAADFDPAFLNDPGQIENFTTSINIRQPLLNPDGFLSRAALKQQVRAIEEQRKRTGFMVIFRVKEQYYQLILAERRVEIVKASLKAARKNLKQADDFFQQGLINKADLLAAEVRLKQIRSDLLTAVNARKTADNQLAYLIGIEEFVTINPVDKLEMEGDRSGEIQIDLINSSRSDMKALDYRIKSAQKMVNADRLSFSPTVNLYGSFEWNDNTLLGTGASNYTIGATLRWDLFNGLKNVNAVQQSKAELAKARLAYRNQAIQNRVEIQQILNNVEEARLQVEITRAGVEQAEESYRIRYNRYEKGMERIADLLSAEATLEESRLNLAGAIFKYNIAVLQLDLQLENNPEK